MLIVLTESGMYSLYEQLIKVFMDSKAFELIFRRYGTLWCKSKEQVRERSPFPIGKPVWIGYKNAAGTSSIRYTSAGYVSYRFPGDHTDYTFTPTDIVSFWYSRRKLVSFLEELNFAEINRCKTKLKDAYLIFKAFWASKWV